MYFKGKAEVRSLDSKQLRDAAILDPQNFIRNETNCPMVIDEIQKAPDLLSEIKLVVDKNRVPGQYVVTGSSDIYSAPETKESLAGRVKDIRMRTFTQGELRGGKPNFLARLFNMDFATRYEECDKHAVLDLALRGGYPECISLSPADRRDWAIDYIKTLLSRDIRDDEHIRRERALRDLLKATAAWSARFLDTDKLTAACGLSRPTYVEYLGALERYYLCERVEAWTNTDYARVGKRPKTYMCDTGLMAAVLNWRMKDIELDTDRVGKLIETFVFTELAAQVDLSSCSLYQYRDNDKREIDFIIENEDGDLIGIEVKAGAGVGKDDFKHIKWFGDNLAMGRKFTGIVLYAGDRTLSFGEGMTAVPIASLWQ